MYIFFRIIIVCQLIVLSLLLTSSALAADYRNYSKIVPLPNAELESVLSRWLMKRGYRVSLISLKDKQYKLVAVKGDKEWQITVMPYSPLASRMSASYTFNNDQPDQTELTKLWEYLRLYSGDIYAKDTVSDQSIPEVILTKANSVVCIKGNINNQPVQFSGLILNNDGIIISTAHDLENARELTIIFSDGRETSGYVIKIDNYNDLSLISFNDKYESSITLKNSRNILEDGERVYSIGCPMNHRVRILSGLINGTLRRVNSLHLWQVKIETLPGSSGSPVFDVKGNLVGVIKGRYRGTQSMGFIITMGTVIEFLSEL